MEERALDGEASVGGTAASTQRAADRGGGEPRSAGRPARGVLEGAFTLLRALPSVRGPHAVRDLAGRTGLPRPTVHRLLQQLQAVGAVTFTDQRYEAAFVDATRADLPTGPIDPLPVGLAEVMRLLREQTGATVALVLPSRAEFVITEVVPGRDPLPVGIFNGRHLPPTAAGALAIDPTADVNRVLTGSRAALDREDTLEGLNCYAVPLPTAIAGTAALQLSTTSDQDPLLFASAARRAVDALTTRSRTR